METYLRDGHFPPGTMQPKIEAALDADVRTEAERDRDRNRRPVETLEFFGFRDDMKVVELMPGGGWYTKLLAPILEGKADVVYGSRFMGSEAHRVLFFWHMIGNKLLTLFTNMVTNLNLTDMETCYKLFKTDIIKSISLKENRFGFEPEVTAKIAKTKNIRIYEIGISYYGRTYKEGKKINWKDGLQAIWCILRYNLF